MTRESTHDNSMRTYIKLDLLTRDGIAKELGVCRRTVTNALDFVTGNELSNRIRSRALELGGIYMTERFVPNCEVSHTQDEMTQTFPGGVAFILSKKDGSGRIVAGGRTIEEFDEVPMSCWSGILAKAQNISEAVTRTFSNRQQI